MNDSEKTRRHGLYSRGSATTQRLIFRLRRPVGPAAPPVWSSQMSALFAVAVLLTIAAGVFDPLVQPFALQSQNAFLRFLGNVTDAAQSGWYIVPAIVIIAIIGLMDWTAIQRGSRRTLMLAYGRAAYILAAIVIPGIVTNIIKQFVGRARPRAMDEAGVYGFSPFEFDSLFQGFPSGHATTAGSLAVILMLWHPRHWWLSLIVMGVLAFARVPAGAHYPSDVVAGFSVGAIGALLIARWLARRRAVFVFRKSGLLPLMIG